MFKMREVTPLSRILAIILFLGVIPVLFFYLGMQYQEARRSADLVQSYGFPRLYTYSVTPQEDASSTPVTLD